MKQPLDRGQRREYRRWQRHLARYEKASWRSAAIQLVNSLAPFVLFWWLMYLSLELNYLIVVALAFPTAGFLVRIFIIEHDCSHGAFFPSRKWNDRLGFCLGVLTLTPFHYWRRTHAIHHSSSGDLDRRDIGDITTITRREYRALPLWARLRYRLYRHPIILFGFGPVFQFVLKHRLPWDLPLGWYREWLSVATTNLALVVILLAASKTMGITAFLMVHLPVCIVSSTAAVWLFFLQHQFESTYWRCHQDWDFGEAALHGSSFYDLPPILHWFTGNIGIHHIHHLAARIPNYRLRQCMAENPLLPCPGRMTIRESLACLRLALWDEERQKLVPFRDGRDEIRTGGPTPRPSLGGSIAIR